MQLPVIELRNEQPSPQSSSARSGYVAQLFAQTRCRALSATVEHTAGVQVTPAATPAAAGPSGQLLASGTQSAALLPVHAPKRCLHRNLRPADARQRLVQLLPVAAHQRHHLPAQKVARQAHILELLRSSIQLTCREIRDTLRSSVGGHGEQRPRELPARLS